jgi:hypothetical protein
MTSFTSPSGLPSADTTGIPINVEARRSAGVLLGASAGACDPVGALDVGASCDEDACCGSGGLAIAAAAEPCEAGCGEAGAPAGSNGPSDWLQEAATKPSAAQMSGRRILIMGAL